MEMERHTELKIENIHGVLFTYLNIIAGGKSLNLYNFMGIFSMDLPNMKLLSCIIKFLL